MRWQDFNVELSERRFELGRSIGEASSDLGLSRDVLFALENGDYERMPQGQEARDALVAYARYLELDENELLDAYERGREEHERGTLEERLPTQEPGAEPNAEPGTAPEEPRSEGRRPRRRTVVLVAVVLLLALAGAAAGALLWMRSSNRETVARSLERMTQVALRPISRVDGLINEYEQAKTPPVDPAVDANIAERARECESKTEWLIVVDCANNRMGIFRGAKDAWTSTEFITVSCGAADGRETERGTFAVEDRGYSFNGFDEEFRAYYTCYYWVRFAGPYLIHSQPYHLESFDLMDARIGQNVSQGCVRLPLEKAKWVYDNIPIETTVVTF